MDLQKSDPSWYLFWVRFIFVFSLFRFLDFVSARFGDQARTLFDVHDPRGNLDPDGGVRLNGVVPFGPNRNTLEGGTIIARVTEVADPRTVTLYKATGGGAGDRICAGTGNAGTTVTLTELNDSGVTGEFDLDASITVDADDAFTLFVEQDWRLAATHVYDGTDEDGEDARSLQSFQNALDEIEGLVVEARDLCATLLLRIMVADEDNARAYGSKFLEAVLRSLLAESGTTDGSGRVSQVRSGALPELVRAATDETTGSTQTFVRRVVDAAAGVPATSNDGQGEIDAHTPEAQMPTGRLKIACVNGKEQGFPTAAQREQFSVEFASDEDDRTKTYSQLLTVGAAYKGEDGAGGAQGFTLERVPTKTNDDTHVQLADQATDPVSASGESLLNTNNGILYGETVVAAGLNSFQFYSSSDRAAASLVAESTGVADGADFTATPANGSGLTIDGTAGSNPTNGATWEIDLNFFSTLNADGEADSFTVDVTLDEEGETSRLVARMPILRSNGFRLVGVASGAELIADDLVRCNTYRDRVGA